MRSAVGAFLCISIVYAGCAWISTIGNTEVDAGNMPRIPNTVVVSSSTLRSKYQQLTGSFHGVRAGPSPATVVTVHGLEPQKTSPF